MRARSALRPRRAALAPGILLLGLAAGAMSCTSGAQRRAAAFRYTVGPLPAPWRAVRIGGARFAFHHADGGSILSNVTCTRGEDDASLEVLTNHLLFQLGAQKELEQRRTTLAEREALRTRLDATLDGVPIAFDLVVMKTDGCTLDLQLVAPPAAVAERTRDFDVLLRGLVVDRREGRR